MSSIGRYLLMTLGSRATLFSKSKSTPASQSIPKSRGCPFIQSFENRFVAIAIMEYDAGASPALLSTPLLHVH